MCGSQPEEEPQYDNNSNNSNNSNNKKWIKRKKNLQEMQKFKFDGNSFPPVPTSNSIKLNSGGHVTLTTTVVVVVVVVVFTSNQ